VAGKAVEFHVLEDCAHGPARRRAIDAEQLSTS
jgi:hypothetical protein